MLKNFETSQNLSNSRQSISENPSIPIGHVKSLSEKFVISSETKHVSNKVSQQIKFLNNKCDSGFTFENNHLFRQNHFGRTKRTFSECSFSSIPESLANRKSSCVSDSVSLIPSNLMEELEARISGRSNNVKMMLRHFETVNSVCNNESESYENSKINDHKEPMNGFNETLISSDHVTSEQYDEYFPRNSDFEEQESIFLDGRKEPNVYNDVPDEIYPDNDIASMDDEIPDGNNETIRNSPDMECTYVTNEQNNGIICHDGENDEVLYYNGDNNGNDELCYGGDDIGSMDEEIPDEDVDTIRNSLDMESTNLTNGHNDGTVCYDGEDDSLSGSCDSYENMINLRNSENEHSVRLGLCKDNEFQEPEVIHQVTDNYCEGNGFGESFPVNCSSPVKEHLVNKDFFSENRLRKLQTDTNSVPNDIYDDIAERSNKNGLINSFKPDVMYEDEETEIIKNNSDSDSNSDSSDSLSQLKTVTSSLSPNLFKSKGYLSHYSDSWGVNHRSNILEQENSVDHVDITHENNNICQNKHEFGLNVTSKFSSSAYNQSDSAQVMTSDAHLVQEVADSKTDGRRESLFSNNSAIYESMEAIQEKIEENKLATIEARFKQKNKTVTFCEPKKELDSISENEYSKPCKREKTRFSSPLKLGLWTKKGKALLFGKKKKTQEQSWTHVDNFGFCDCPDPDVVYIRVPDPSDVEESRMKRNESPMSDNSDHTYMAMNGIKARIPEVGYELSESELVHSKLSELLNSRPDEFL